jgi:hypothetical protein
VRLWWFDSEVADLRDRVVALTAENVALRGRDRDASMRLRGLNEALGRLETELVSLAAYVEQMEREWAARLQHPSSGSDDPQ